MCVHTGEARAWVRWRLPRRPRIRLCDGFESASGRAAPARLVGSPREETLRLFLADILQLRDEDFFDGCGQLRDRRALEETAQGDGGLKVLPQTGEHLSSEQRVAA